MKVAVKDIKGQSQGELEVNFQLVEDGRGTQAVHDAVVASPGLVRSRGAAEPVVTEG